MSSGKTNVWKRIFDLWAFIVKMVQNGRRSPEWLANKLQAIADEPAPKFELHLHPKQEAGGVIRGSDLEIYLIETKRIERALSLESPEVQGWLKNPETYPKEFRGRAICLWGSIRESGGHRKVACLIWDGNRVKVYWSWLGYDWRGGGYPALLRPKAESEVLQG